MHVLFCTSIIISLLYPCVILNQSKQTFQTSFWVLLECLFKITNDKKIPKRDK